MADALLIWIDDKGRRNFELGQAAGVWGLPGPQRASATVPDIVVFGAGAAGGPRQPSATWETRSARIWVAEFVGPWFSYSHGRDTPIWNDPTTFSERFRFRNFKEVGLLPLAADVNFRRSAAEALRRAGGVGTVAGKPVQAQVVNVNDLLFLASGPMPVTTASIAAGAPPATNASASVFDPAAFDGDLEDSRLAPVRLEQRALRGIHIGGSSAVCALCGQVLPSSLLIAAHIKRRSVCTDAEKRDLHNIAMVNCALGCDALYERGFVGVLRNGRLRFSKAADPIVHQTVLAAQKRMLANTPVWRPQNAQYFDWHFENVFASRV